MGEGEPARTPLVHRLQLPQTQAWVFWACRTWGGQAHEGPCNSADLCLPAPGPAILHLQPCFSAPGGSGGYGLPGLWVTAELSQWEGQFEMRVRKETGAGFVPWPRGGRAHASPRATARCSLPQPLLWAPGQHRMLHHLFTTVHLCSHQPRPLPRGYGWG